MQDDAAGRHLVIEEISHAGYRCLRLARGGLAVTVTVDVGPRVIAFTSDGGPSPFALTPDLTIDRPGLATFRMHGGHRLWCAPEVPEMTYLPDDRPVEVRSGPEGATFGSFEPRTGIRKELRISIGDAGVVVDHVLRNQGASPVRHAPWAITMLTLGGEAWIPQSQDPLDPGGFQGNRSIVLWPYSLLTDERLVVGDRLLRVRAPEGVPGRFKLGTQANPGWLAYRLGAQLFVKRARHLPGSEYVDLGASAQCYVGDRFIEVETLGPIVTLQPGGSTEHRETWSLHTVGADADPEATIAGLGLPAQGRN